ncbi:MAG: PIG-L family deacetylase, partial [Chitinophagaceae bacterium]|nr:PIG-L family deacetylase [Chitinophagaceae bacterium]
CQIPKSYSSSEIFQQIKKLNVLGSVLYIAAHPDDENSRLLAWLANEKLYRTGYLSITRGDGGQNLIGDEQGIELGLIRTQELLSARRIDGAEQFFTRAYDFGYSKSPEETFKLWNKQKILSDVVWVIRKFQPDVIITRFPTTGEGGHGQHTASAILAEEAFDLAGDATKFTEHFKHGVKPWKPKRLLWNTFNFGTTNTQKDDQFKVDAGGYNALLGKSYGEIAAESRSQHKSQGFGVPRSRGGQLEFFKTIKGDEPVNELMDGIQTEWDRLNNVSIKNSAEAIIKNYSFVHPEYSVPQLVSLYRTLTSIDNEYWRNQKIKDILQLIEATSGLYMEATTSQPYAVQADSLHVIATINNRSGIAIKNAEVEFANSHFTLADTLKRNANARQNLASFIREDEKITQPYWLEQPLQKGSFDVKMQERIGKPENDALSLVFNVEIEGQKFSFVKPIQYKTNDPVKGEQYQPLVIVPKIELRFVGDNFLSLNNKPVQVYTNFKSNGNDSAQYILTKHFSKNINTDRTTYNYNSGQNKESFESSVFTPDNTLRNYKEEIALSSGYKKQGFRNYRKTIKYDHIPEITYFPEATANFITVDLKIAGNKIGYIAGAGDKVPEALQQMGYGVTMLKETDLTESNLKQFDAIVTGVRAYNVHEWLSNSYDVLMAYIKNGGVLLVQYNTNSNAGPMKAKIAPYPFLISRNRITEEDARINFIQPGHPLLNYPNKITHHDFEGWVQERSTYHAESLDSNYQTIISIKDTGEQEHNGSLIIADFGKGKFIYTGISFFRQLPAGVPGAYRLFANLLSPRLVQSDALLKAGALQNNKTVTNKN